MRVFGLIQRCQEHVKGTGHIVVLLCVETECFCNCQYFHVFQCVYVVVSSLPEDICF